jgi:ankyrin repeat protein
MEGRRNIIEILIKKGCNLDIKNNDDKTPLDVAKNKEQMETQITKFKGA